MRDIALINYLGRLVYSFERLTSHEGDTFSLQIAGNATEFTINESKNLFRLDEHKLHGQAARSYQLGVENIIDAIMLKRLVDMSICCEITKIGEEGICHSTYTNSFIFPQFTSNIEDHYFSKTGFHIAKVGSLSSYGQIDFNCFDSLTNANIQFILTNGARGTEIEISDPISRNMAQMVSLFLCETSRNPTSFITIPMCLELGEYLFALLNSEEPNIEEFTAKVGLIHSRSTNYMNLSQKLVELKEKLGSKVRDITKLEQDISAKFIDLTTLESMDEGEDFRITEIFPKSRIMKDVVLSLFPLALEKAVQGSRYINAAISKEFDGQSAQSKARIQHMYDEKTGSISDAQKIHSVEGGLLEIYLASLHPAGDGSVRDGGQTQKIFTDIANQWFGIEDLGIPDSLDGEVTLIQQNIIDGLIGEDATSEMAS